MPSDAFQSDAGDTPATTKDMLGSRLKNHKPAAHVLPVQASRSRCPEIAAMIAVAFVFHCTMMVRNDIRGGTSRAH
jgi:hypothetical protein